jgi:hypothetical protein
VLAPLVASDTRLMRGGPSPLIIGIERLARASASNDTPFVVRKIND